MKKKRWNATCSSGWKKIFFIMRITVLFLVAGLMQVTAANVYSQALNVKVENASVLEVLKMIENQSDFHFLYRSDNLKDLPEVSIDMQDAKLEDVLNKVLVPNGFTFEVDDRTVVIKRTAPTALTSPAEQQKKGITGTVTDENGQPVPGATILIKGTTLGTITDGDGKFKLSVPSDAKALVFSFVGMSSQEADITKKTTLKITLREKAVQLDEVVALGYGVMTSREKVSGSVSTVSPALLADRGAITSPLSLLSGLATGVRVTTATSLPGTTPVVVVREASSWNQGIGLLYVIDGVVRDVDSFQALNPNDIASMSVLKDAASAAIYGMKAGNGVLLVTTKSGVSGKLKIDFNFSYASSVPYLLGHKLNAYDFALQQNRWNTMIGLPANSANWYTAEELTFFKTHTYNAYNDFWSNPRSKNYNIALSGGNETSKYYLSASWNTMDQPTLSVNYNKYTILTKLETKLNKRLTLNFRMSASWDKNTRPQGDITGSGLNFGNLYMRPATQPYFMAVSGVKYPLDPTIATVMGGGGGSSTFNNFRVNPMATLKYDIPGIKGLNASVQFAYNNSYSNDKLWVISPYYYRFIMNRHITTTNFDYANASGWRGQNVMSNNTYQSLTEDYGTTSGYQGNYQLNYAGTFGKHHVSAFGGYEFRGSTGESIQAYRQGFALLSYNEINGGSNATGNFSNSGDISGQDGMASWIGRLDYSFDDKYILGATVRRDGSYKFAPAKRWGNFPAASAAWIISKEGFFEPIKSVLSSAKLRASYGMTGTDNTAAWQWQYTYAGGSQATNGTYTYSTLAPSVVPNPNITWETNTNYNLGFDFGFLNNKLTFSPEIWYNKTSNILGTRTATTPLVVGANLPAVNYGIASAQGIEFTGNYVSKIGEVAFSVGGNIAFSSNKVLKEDEAAGTRKMDIRVDHPMDVIRVWGINVDRTGNGVIRTLAEAERIAAENAVGASKYTTTGGQIQPGQVYAQDVRGSNGGLFANTPDGNVNQNTNDDKIVLTHKYGSPRTVFGLNANVKWRGIELNMIAAGVGAYWRAWDRGVTSLFAQFSDFWPNEWTASNINAGPSPLYAIGAGWPGGGTDKPSTLNTYNMSFMRMKHISLGYTIPNVFLQKLGIKGLKVIANVENPFMFYKMCPQVMDPESNEGNSYPILRNYSLGVNITL